MTITSVNRVFSGKSHLCNKINDQWLNDCLKTFIETYVLVIVSNKLFSTNE